MKNIIFFIIVGTFWALSMIGYGHTIYTSIRDDIRREKERKSVLKYSENK